MREILYTSQFKKDCKGMQKTAKLRRVIKKLAAGEKLEKTYRDHKLKGRWNKHRECHISGDCLLIYRMTRNELILERLGSHSELFG